MQISRLGMIVSGILIGVLGMSGPSATEEQYPSRLIRLIVPYPPGGQMDMVGRLIAEGLSKKWGQTVIVENIPGAGGNVGFSTAFRSRPDGYTLVITSPSFITNQFVIKNSPWSATQWSPISVLATTPYVLAARPGFNAETAKELVVAAKAKPGMISYASSGIGSSSHLSGVQLEVLTGSKLLHVPYRGAAAALTDIMAGRVDVVFDAIVTALPVWKGGKVKVLGVTSRTRSLYMPDVPTLTESGVPGFEAESWTALVAPPSTPPAIVEKVSAATRDVLRDPKFADRLKTLHLDVVGSTQEETATYFELEAKRWKAVLANSGISID